MRCGDEMRKKMIEFHYNNMSIYNESPKNFVIDSG